MIKSVSLGLLHSYWMRWRRSAEQQSLLFVYAITMKIRREMNSSGKLKKYDTSHSLSCQELITWSLWGSNSPWLVSNRRWSLYFYDRLCRLKMKWQKWRATSTNWMKIFRPRLPPWSWLTPVWRPGPTDLAWTCAGMRFVKLLSAACRVVGQKPWTAPCSGSQVQHGLVAEVQQLEATILALKEKLSEAQWVLLLVLLKRPYSYIYASAGQRLQFLIVELQIMCKIQ